MGNKLKNFGLIAALVLLGSSIAFSDYIKSGAERVIENAGAQDLILRVGGQDSIIANGPNAQAQAGMLGTGAVPAWSFSTDPDTGIFSNGNNLGFAAGGSERGQVASTGFRTLSGNAGSPGYSFINDSTTGLWLSGANFLVFSQGGAQKLAIDTNSVDVASGNDLRLNAGDAIIAGVVTQSGTGGDTPHDCVRTASSTTSTNHTVTCGAGKILTGGGCAGTGAFALENSYPLSMTQWQCNFSGSMSITAYAICCDI